jgi:hypothetical protein
LRSSTRRAYPARTCPGSSHSVVGGRPATARRPRKARQRAPRHGCTRADVSAHVLYVVDAARSRERDIRGRSDGTSVGRVCGGGTG